jgi:hypothetical protein
MQLNCTAEGEKKKGEEGATDEENGADLYGGETYGVLKRGTCPRKAGGSNLGELKRGEE